MSACSDVIDIVWTTLTTPPTILRSNLLCIYQIHVHESKVWLYEILDREIIIRSIAINYNKFTTVFEYFTEKKTSL